MSTRSQLNGEPNGRTSKDIRRHGPGAAAFRRLVVKKGIKISEDEAKAFAASQSRGQIFQGRLKSDGRITASRPNAIFQVDLIDYTKKSAEGSRYILAVVDVFSRKLGVEPIASKDPGSVVVALREVFLRSLYPEQITTNMGQEFLGKPVANYLQEAGIVHATKDLTYIGEHPGRCGQANRQVQEHSAKLVDQAGRNMH